MSVLTQPTTAAAGHRPGAVVTQAPLGDRPMAVWRMRGWPLGGTYLRYGGWQASCRVCSWWRWGNDQADALDRARAHCREGAHR